MKSKRWAIAIAWLPGILTAVFYGYTVRESYKELADPVNRLCQYWDGAFAFAPYQSLEAVVRFSAPFLLLLMFLLGGVVFTLWKINKLTPVSALIALAIPVIVICISLGDPMALGPAYEQSYMFDCPQQSMMPG